MGSGASAVLRVVAQRLAVASSEAPAGMKFDQIIHIDCSKWESRRAVQRAIVEQLKLPVSVMDILNRQDEEDDLNGLAQGSRAEIQQVVTEIYRHTQNQRFVVIFHHGSREDIDLTKLGLPLFGYAGNKMLWTFRGRFRLNLWVEVDKAVESIGVPTDVFLRASHHEQDPHKLWSLLAHQEAAEVARMVIDTSGIVCQPAQVEECLLYMLKICAMTGGQHFINYDLATHSSNYWICDGIIKHQGDDDGGNDEAWRAADALQNEMQLGVDCNNQYLSAHLSRGVESTPYWASPGYGVLLIPANGDIFKQFNRLGVLKLSHCTFRFSSPPYLYCQSLRFLWLDHCQDQVISTNVVGEMVNQDIHQCFQRLWVLDVRYTSCDWILSASLMDAMTHLRELNVEGAQDWDIGQLQGRLPNIRKLRVKKSTVHCSGHSEQDLFQGMNKMELLDLSGNHTMQGVTKFSEISTSNNCLETMIIIDGSGGLQKFSLKGCAKLKNLLLSGLFEDLRILDLSGTAVKTLDLSAMTASSLDELFLHDCQKLCAILWPPEDKRKRNLQKLHIDTTCSAAALIPMNEKSTEDITAANIMTLSSASLSVVHGGKAISEFNWCIGVRDARLLRSLEPFKQYFMGNIVAHVEIYSPAAAFSSSNDNKAASSNSSIKQQHVPLVKVDKPTNSFLYADVEVTLKDHPLLQPSEGDAPMLTQIWPCPSIHSYNDLTCYTHIQDHQLSTKSLTEGEQQTMNSIIIPDMLCHNASILHVHDSLSITNILGPAPALGSTWYYLTWCRVERCPKLEHAFTAPQLQASGDVVVFKWLKTFWASELAKARYIWNWAPPSLFQLKQQSFEDFKLLHMDLCPRVIHVLPLALQMVSISLGNLETLEIVWCGDLREVFPLYTRDTKNEQQSATTVVRFQHLKRIHLHELPKLQGICGRWRISAPELETIKIRGCWSLKRLPAIGNNTSKKVECDCEKEWWDKLEWDGLGASHHPSLYNVTHSRYYKKNQLKGSVLR